MSIFKTICIHQLSRTRNSNYPTSSKLIILNSGISKSKVLSELRKLRSENLIELVKISDVTLSKRLKKVVGYVITEKGKHTLEYQEALQEVNKSFTGG